MKHIKTFLGSILLFLSLPSFAWNILDSYNTVLSKVQVTDCRLAENSRECTYWASGEIVAFSFMCALTLPTKLSLPEAQKIMDYEVATLKNNLKKWTYLDDKMRTDILNDDNVFLQALYEQASADILKDSNDSAIRACSQNDRIIKRNDNPINFASIMNYTKSGKFNPKSKPQQKHDENGWMGEIN